MHPPFPQLCLAVVLLLGVSPPVAAQRKRPAATRPDTVRFKAISSLSYDDTEPALLGARVANPADFPASLYTDNGKEKCTSTLVGPRALLTAAHCIKPGAIVVMSIGGATYTAGCNRPTQYPANTTADWALCLVDRAVEDVRYEKVNVRADLFKRGDSLLLSGFGCATPDKKGDGIYRIGEAPVHQLPNGSNNAIVAKGSVALCYGDSGGPAFAYLDELKTERVQVSVNSRGNVQDVSHLSSLTTPQATLFFQSWAQRNGVGICGITAGVSGCR